jgi:hypothetical protein
LRRGASGKKEVEKAANFFSRRVRLVEQVIGYCTYVFSNVVEATAQNSSRTSGDLDASNLHEKNGHFKFRVFF